MATKTRSAKSAAKRTSGPKRKTLARKPAKPKRSGAARKPARGAAKKAARGTVSRAARRSARPAARKTVRSVGRKSRPAAGKTRKAARKPVRKAARPAARRNSRGTARTTARTSARRVARPTTRKTSRPAARKATAPRRAARPAGRAATKPAPRRSATSRSRAAPGRPAVDGDAQLATHALRFLAMDAVEQAKSGHPGMPMGMADIATVLWGRFLNFSPRNPNWFNRDRFVLSNGHGSMLLYGLLHLCGYDLPMEELRRFRQLHSKTPGHPEAGHTPGVEVTTGPLGQGISNAVGLALAERWLATRFNKPGHDIVNHRTFVFCGDGDLEEGVSHESCSLAGHLGLSRLVAFYDDNHITIDGETSLSFSEDVPRRFSAYGWHTQVVDGHNPGAIARAVERALAEPSRPSLIACRTIIGWGAPTKAGTESTHGSPLGEEEIAATRRALKWNYPPFEVPPAATAYWFDAAERGQATEREWNARLQTYRNAYPSMARELDRIIEQRPSTDWQAPLEALRAKWLAQPPEADATRTASGKVLEAFAMSHPDLIGGSADLTPSNNTRIKAYEDVKPRSFSGKYVRYGIREHGMGAIMTGMARHGGVVPYAGTFLTFSDYMRPSVRLAALTGVQVIYVWTHDSIGLGEDGPTHQPVEHYAALRAIPNLRVYRPADTRETLESWIEALKCTTGPSALLLTRQKLPTLEGTGKGGVGKGGYVLADTPTGVPLRVLLLGTGSELHLAVKAREVLAQEGIGARVVSIPCWEVFSGQPRAYQQQVLPPGITARVAVEAGIRQGWDHWIGSGGAMVGMNGYGGSAPAADLFAHFDITADAVVRAARSQVA